MKIWQQCTSNSSKMAARKNLWYDVFVGSETGFLKGVNTGQQYFKNVNIIGETLDRQQEILTMCWGNADETQIYCGLKNRHVKVYDVEDNTYRETGFVVEGGSGDLRGFYKHDGGFITCVESGLLKVWDNDGKRLAFKSTGYHTHRMRPNPAKPWLVATGGRETYNDLKIWNLEALDEPIFQAVNVPNDFLNLPIPIWVTDMQFLQDSDCLAVCTGHGHVRLYDPRTPKFSPVSSMQFCEYPLTAMALVPNSHQVIVATTRGRVARIDVRKMKVLRGYKSFAGSVRGIHVHPTKNLVVTCGLDRFLRIHELREEVARHKVYLKSRLNCVLFRNAEQTKSGEEPENAQEVEGTEDLEIQFNREEKKDTVKNVPSKEDNRDDELWADMQVVNDDVDNNLLSTEKKQRKAKKGETSKKSIKKYNKKQEMRDTMKKKGVKRKI